MEKIENRAAEVMARIIRLEEDKRLELESIERRITALELEAADAKRKKDGATEVTDFDVYDAADKRIIDANKALEMYRARREQLINHEYVSEEESDAVISSLLNYETELTAGYRNAIREPITKLAEINKKYIKDVAEAENVIRNWTTRIHKNYRRRGTVYANGTDRSDSPQPVRIIPFTGCPESKTISDFIERMK